MLESSISSAPESSWFLWLVAAGAAAMAAFAAFGWLREAQRSADTRYRAIGVAVSALTLASAMCGCAVLGLASEPLTFSIGYPHFRAFEIWAIAVAACVPVGYALRQPSSLRRQIVCGLWLAACATVIAVAWIDAVGFRPGVEWRDEVVAAAAAVLMLGLTCGLTLAFSPAAQHGRRRQAWRIGGAALFGLSLMTGYEVLIAGAELAEQTGSVYRNHLSSTTLSLLAAVAVPLAVVIVIVDLETRRQTRRRQRRRRGGRSGDDAAQSLRTAAD